MLEEKLVFVSKEGIQEEGSNNLWKRKVSCRNHALSSTLRSKGFDVDEEINIMMDGTTQHEFNGYMCNIFYDATSDGTLKRTFPDSMNEGMNQKRNGKNK